MSTEPSEILIGVDGGGTSCRIVIERGGRRWEHKIGPANVASDFDGALARLGDGLREAAAKAGLSPEVLENAVAFMGLAGVLGPEDGAAVAQKLKFRKIRVDSDRVSAIAGALGDATGTLAGLGTGSFVIRQDAGTTRALGGWGLALGDEASGAWLGRGLLARTLQAVDGMGPASDLTRRVRAEFSGSCEKIAHFGVSAGPGDFAAWAPKVFEAAFARDPVALDLVQEGAGWIEKAAHVLGWSAGEALCLTGGLGPRYSDYLSQPLRAALTPPKGTPLDGALSLARVLARADP